MPEVFSPSLLYHTGLGTPLVAAKDFDYCYNLVKCVRLLRCLAGLEPVKELNSHILELFLSLLDYKEILVYYYEVSWYKSMICSLVLHNNSAL